jgi:hypothetical protein
MSTPITPIRRQPCCHARVVMPVGLIAVVCGGSASSLNATFSSAGMGGAFCGGNTAHFTVVVTGFMHG